MFLIWFAAAEPTKLSPRCDQLIIVLLPKRSLARLQLAENFYQLAAQGCGDIQFLAFAQHVGQGEVDFAGDSFLHVAKRAFAVIRFPSLGELIDRSNALVGGIARVKVGGGVYSANQIQRTPSAYPPRSLGQCRAAFALDDFGRLGYRLHYDYHRGTAGRTGHEFTD